MAHIHTALQTVRRLPLAHFPTPEAVEQLCTELAYDFRNRLLTPWLTLQLFCLQVLYQNTAIAHLRQLSGINFSPASYCEARQRLPIELFQALLGRMGDSIRNMKINTKVGADHPVLSRRILMLDGSTFSMPDIRPLLEYFGMPAGQAPGVGYPLAKFMAVLDYATGMFLHVAVMHHCVHDMAGAQTVRPLLKRGEIIVADAAFCSFVHLCQLRDGGVDAILRLHQRRPKRAGVQQWNRPPADQRPAWISIEQWEAFPLSIRVRVVKHTIRRDGFRNQVFYIATTLLDKEQWADDLVADIYAKRWNIETCFDHIKTTMNMSVLKCKTVDGILKELAVYMIVYNMVRLAMLQAAGAQGVDPERISLIDAARALAVRFIGLPGVPTLIENPLRPNRVEPRVRRRRPKNYPLMTKPRHWLKAAIFVKNIA